MAGLVKCAQKSGIQKGVPGDNSNKSMQLSDKQIREFQAIHKKVFGKTISKERAMADGLMLIRLVYLAQPIKGAIK